MSLYRVILKILGTFVYLCFVSGMKTARFSGMLLETLRILSQNVLGR